MDKLDQKILEDDLQTPKIAVKFFNSQEEAERYNMIENINKTDMEKFQLFCKMLKMQRLYKNAKIYNMKDIKKI